MYPIVMRIFTTMPYIELFVNKFLEKKLRFLQSKMYDFLAAIPLIADLLHVFYVSLATGNHSHF